MIEKNFIKLYEDSFKENWDLPALTEYGSSNTYLYKDVAYEIARLHVLFNYLKIQKGSKIALIGKNSISWCTTYIAAMTYGAVIVPILQDFHPDSVHHIVNHSDSELLFVTDSIWDTLDDVQMGQLKAVFLLNDYSCVLSRLKVNIVKNWEYLVTEKYSHFDKDDIKYASVNNSEVVLINYTSGTTGFSKGVMLTGENLAGNVLYAKQLELLYKGERVLSFLPLAHAYGCAFDFLFALSEGVHINLLGKVPSPKILSSAFAEVRPNLIISVPLVLEKIYRKVILPKLDEKSVKYALKVPLLKNIVYKKIRESLIESLGGEFKEVIIGGAALNKEVEAFLYKIKFPFTVGYGMTECGPLISYDHHWDFIPTSCGKILSTMEVRIDSEDPYNKVGEVQVRGINVMKGYYKNEEATQNAFTDDGWLKTGDLGTIDKDDRIYLRGRSKTMILGSSGQNIFPEEIEDRLNNLPYIMESLVVSRGGKLVALVYLDYEAINATDLTESEIAKIMEHNKATLNKLVSNYETISAIQIYPTEFEKTPKKSIKRYLYEN